MTTEVTSPDKVWRAEFAPFWRVSSMTPAQAKLHSPSMIFPTELAAVWCIILELQGVQHDINRLMSQWQKRKEELQR